MSSRVRIANSIGVVVAVSLALVAASYRTPAATLAAAPALTPCIEIIAMPDGRRGLRDATGQVIELKPYRRIVAGSLVADRLLHELAEPDRVVGVSGYGRAQSPWAYQQADKPVLASTDDVEGVLSLAPDLLLLNSFGESAKVARLRERGIAVFDLGEMGGVDTLVRDIHIVAQLLGHPERGERLATAWQRRFAAIAGALQDRARKRALLLTTYGGKVFGGTRGSSYGDVLAAAGLVDVAAASYTGWPQYSAEELLRLDPDLIVTKYGMGAQLCRIGGLESLKACRGGDFVEIDGALLDDPGLPMLDAAEAIFAIAYPDAK